MTTPFLGTEALASGRVSRRALKNGYDSVYRNVYLPRGEVLTSLARAQAAWLWSDRKATTAGLSAAALHGSRWIDARLPAELYRINGKPVDGIVIHRDTLHADEVGVASGIPATTPARTAFDLGRRKGRDRAVIRLDSLAQATGMTAADISPLIARHRGVRGLVQLRDVLALMDGGAESPQETRTRLALIDAGLSRPTTQLVVCDGPGHFVARLDMGWEKFKVAVEYDGEQHWTDPLQRAKDIDRLAKLAEVGWAIIRVSADILRYRPHVIIARVCQALHAAGAEWPVIARILGTCVS